MRRAALTVLVVEDNKIYRTVMLKQLEVLGYRAVVARNGWEGLHKWQSNWFDLVLTDCHMPIMDDFQMTQTIREEEIETCLERTPIIAVTANALHGESAKCLASGMDDYIPKPVEIGGLESKSFCFLGCNFAQKTAYSIRANFSAKNVRLT